MTVADKTMTKNSEQLTKGLTPAATTPSISPLKTFGVLFSLGILFGVISLLLHLYLYSQPSFPGLNTLIRFLGVDSERSLPTWYSSALLLLCSLTLFSIFGYRRSAQTRYPYAWLGLGVIFMGMSFDETVAFHEDVGTIIQQAYGFSGGLYFAWVIPAAIFLLIFGAVYLKFFLRLPAKVRYLILIAAVAYVGSALGIEVIGSRHFDVYGAENLTYAIMTTAEEGLEMSGTALFLYALLVYITEFGWLRQISRHKN